jgi:hypothetical protein
MTVIRPLKQPVEMPQQTKIALESSRGAAIAGVGVILATIALYAYFF